MMTYQIDNRLNIIFCRINIVTNKVGDIKCIGKRLETKERIASVTIYGTKVQLTLKNLCCGVYKKVKTKGCLKDCHVIE